jgi:phosphoglycolate phosphatase
MSYDLLVFDLDGTLVDSADDISDSLRRVLARMGRPSVSHADVVAAIGAGVRKLVERTTPAPHEPVVEAFMAEYAGHLLDRTRLFPGVAELLPRMAPRKIVLSNKPERLCRRIVDGLGISAHFDGVFGGDSFPERKPDAACFRRAAGDAKRPLMIGDSGTDVLTAKNAGVACCAVTWGYFKPGEIDAADFKVSRFDQLLELLR